MLDRNVEILEIDLYVNSLELVYIPDNYDQLFKIINRNKRINCLRLTPHQNYNSTILSENNLNSILQFIDDNTSITRLVINMFLPQDQYARIIEKWTTTKNRY